MKRLSGNDGKTAWFEFKNSALSETIRIEWDFGATVIVLPAPIASTMLARGYANSLTNEQLEQYNAAVQEPATTPAAPATPTPPAKPVPAATPAAPATPTPAPTKPAVPATPTPPAAPVAVPAKPTPPAAKK